jgi:hypothetical protein
MLRELCGKNLPENEIISSEHLPAPEYLPSPDEIIEETRGLGKALPNQSIWLLFALSWQERVSAPMRLSVRPHCPVWEDPRGLS